MPLFARELDVPPRPFAIAAAVADEPGSLFLFSAAGSGPSYVACCPMDRVVGLDPEPRLAMVPSARTLSRVPRWFGILPYEARRHLERPAWGRPEARPEPHHGACVWYRYGAIAEISERVRVIGDEPSIVDALARKVLRGGSLKAVSVTHRPEPEPDAVHAARIERALELIREGHVYQVNLARRVELTVTGRPLDLLASTVRRAPSPFAMAAALDDTHVVSTSPELFLEVDVNRRLRTRPIKGTRPRGQDASTDVAQIAELDADPKERAELAMIIDVERNDVGRVAAVGSVRVPRPPRVETYGGVHHRVAEVQGRLRTDVARSELLEAMLPSGSVTGAPKIRAMEVIAELEAHRRGLYTGAFGILAHDGSLRLAMAIRTLTVRDGVGHYFAGGGIVADSDPAREVLETRWKAAQVTRLFSE